MVLSKRWPWVQMESLYPSALPALGCIAGRMCNTNDCPAGIATQKKALRERVDQEKAANRLHTFLTASTELMKVMARACGHDALHKFNRHDLATRHSEMARITDIRYAGLGKP